MTATPEPHDPKPCDTCSVSQKRCRNLASDCCDQCHHVTLTHLDQETP
jgi:hypothetical protein